MKSGICLEAIKSMAEAGLHAAAEIPKKLKKLDRSQIADYITIALGVWTVLGINVDTADLPSIHPSQPPAQSAVEANTADKIHLRVRDPDNKPVELELPSGTEARYARVVVEFMNCSSTAQIEIENPSGVRFTLHGDAASLRMEAKLPTFDGQYGGRWRFKVRGCHRQRENSILDLAVEPSC